MKFALVATAAVSLASCGPATDAPTSTRSNGVDMLDIPFGQPHPQFMRSNNDLPPFGVHFIGTPIVDGPLAGTFYDFTVQVDHFESRVIGATAERIMVSLDACREHHSRIEGHLRSAFSIEGDSPRDPYTLELEAGELSLSLTCHFVSGSQHPTLQLSILNSSVAAEVQRAWQGEAGR